MAKPIQGSPVFLSLYLRNIFLEQRKRICKTNNDMSN